MKKRTIFTAFLATFMMVATSALAQEENGFKKFNVVKEFTDNGFQWFRNPKLLAAGNKEKSNAMTPKKGADAMSAPKYLLTVPV